MSASTRPPTRSRRQSRRLWFLSRNAETRSIQIGVAGTVLIHLLLFLLVPPLLRLKPSTGYLPKAEQPPEFNIELAPEEFTPPPEESKPPPPDQFVETNPNVPDNVPDETRNFSSQNQQSAQENPTEDMSTDRPTVEGDNPEPNMRIIDGRMAPPSLPVPAVPPKSVEPTPTPPRPAAPKREQNPLSGFENIQGDADDSIGSNIAKVPTTESAAAMEKVEGAKDVPLMENASTARPVIDPNNPRPRPRVQQTARPAFLAENKLGTKNIGAVAIDAKWSNYGQYIQQMLDAVQVQWERILTQSLVYPSVGSHVQVTFMLNQQGNISRIVSVKGTAGDLGKHTCVSAITYPAPYGEWTTDMVTMLGEEQEMTFNFYFN